MVSDCNRVMMVSLFSDECGMRVIALQNGMQCVSARVGCDL